MPTVMKAIAECKDKDISEVRKGAEGRNLCYGNIQDKYREGK